VPRALLGPAATRFRARGFAAARRDPADGTWPVSRQHAQFSSAARRGRRGWWDVGEPVGARVGSRCIGIAAVVGVGCPDRGRDECCDASAAFAQGRCGSLRPSYLGKRWLVVCGMLDGGGVVERRAVRARVRRGRICTDGDERSSDGERHGGGITEGSFTPAVELVFDGHQHARLCRAWLHAGGTPEKATRIGAGVRRGPDQRGAWARACSRCRAASAARAGRLRRRSSSRGSRARVVGIGRSRESAERVLEHPVGRQRYGLGSGPGGQGAGGAGARATCRYQGAIASAAVGAYPRRSEHALELRTFAARRRLRKEITVFCETA